MSDFRLRLGLLLILLIPTLPLVRKSRPVPHPERAAFLRYTAGSVLVKLRNIGELDGVYRFPDGSMVNDVKMLTKGVGAVRPAGAEGDRRVLHNGDCLEPFVDGAGNTSILLTQMTVRERIMLSIPLDPDSLSIDEWEALPGIGASLARAIVNDRQKYGDFRGLEGLARVPGIGPGKIDKIRKYFAAI